MHLSGNDSTGSFLSCEDADTNGADAADAGSCGEFVQLPAHLPVMCDVDADTVVIQQTLKLPVMKYAPCYSPDKHTVFCDVEAPTLILKETPSLVLQPTNPCNPCIPFQEDTHEKVRIFSPKYDSTDQTLKLQLTQSAPCHPADKLAVICDVEAPTVILKETPSLVLQSTNPFVDPCIPHQDASHEESTILSPNSNVAGCSRRRSSFLVPLDNQVRIGGISKRRSSCAFALAPLATFSPDQAIAEVSFQQQEIDAPSVVAESPLPVFVKQLSPCLGRASSSASKRRTFSAQSPMLAVDTRTPKRLSLSGKSPQVSKASTPLKIETQCPEFAVLSGVTPLTTPAVSEIVDAIPAAIQNVGENVDPNLSKKTPEKKKRRLYNPARIPDALLEE